MSTRQLLEAIRSWNIDDLLDPRAHVAKRLNEITDEQERELVDMLAPAAAQCEVEGKLSTMPNFMPRGNQYNRTGCEPFQEVGWLVGHRKSAAGQAVFREMFGGHASREVRLASGHFLLAYDGTGKEIADGAVSRAADLVGWFRLWAAAQVAINANEAFVAIADRIATATDRKTLLDAAMDVGWHASVRDPRWADLALMTLEQSPRHHAAFTVLAGLRDRRVVPMLLDEVQEPDYGTSSIGMQKLAQVLDGVELVEALAPIIEATQDKGRFEAFFAGRGIQEGIALIAAAKQARAKKVAKKKLPFLFFGAQPGDWYEGANDGHLYIVCFDGILDAKKKAKLARALAKLPDCEFASDAWRWGELDGNTWAYFYCGGEPFEALRVGLPALHKAAKIREVIFGGVREESERDEWTLWSHGRGTAATRVPALDRRIDVRMIWYFAGREVVEIAGARDDAFEAAR